MTKLIEAKNLTVSFGREDVLQQVDFSLNAGEIVTIVGPNGSGKSTLLRALVGAQKHTSGQVWRKPELRIGYVPQRLHLDRSLPITVQRFLNLPRRLSAEKLEQTTARTGISALTHQQMSELSGGQLQRVLLARSLLDEPEVLVLDEATQGLDQPGSADFYQQVGQVRDEFNCAVLMVSHELHVVMSATDRVICLNRHICCQGAPDVVSSRPEYRALFGTGTGGALALYRHEHDHSHTHDHPVDQSATEHTIRTEQHD